MNIPQFVPVALATLESSAPVGPEWIHEEKLDGYRIESVLAGGSLRLLSRSGKDWTSRFPSVAEALLTLPVTSAVLDGEIVAVDERGVASFQRLQQSLHSHEIRAVRYHVFDLLWLNGTDLRELPLAFRREFLNDLLLERDRNSVVHKTRQFHIRHGDPLARACALGIEGVVSKRADAAYPVGRTPLWIKSKCVRRQEFVVVGYTDPEGSRHHLGALLLGVYHGSTLRYAGKVGTGFDERMLRTLWRALRARAIAVPDVQSSGALPRAGAHWVRPELVAEIAFTEWTTDGVLRHPVFKGLRTDKRARTVRRED